MTRFGTHVMQRTTFGGAIEATAEVSTNYTSQFFSTNETIVSARTEARHTIYNYLFKSGVSVSSQYQLEATKRFIKNTVLMRR